jgi:hypothetical protein
MEDIWKIGTWNLLTGFSAGVGVTQLLGPGGTSTKIMAVLWLALATIAAHYSNKYEEKVEWSIR